MKNILITGGAGFLGRHLSRKLISTNTETEVTIIARNENDLVETILTCHNHKRLKTVIGDIRDTELLKYVLREVDTVIHLAAMKHIDFCEQNSSEAISINVDATSKLLNLFTGDTFVGMSTDKAVEATGCYGATKLLLEKLILEQARIKPSQRYMIVRSGNIFGSQGSVIDRWKRQIKEHNKITVTHLGMTRFFIHVNNLVEFILGILEKGTSGNIYIPYQKVATLENLAKAIISLYGNEKTEMEIIGLREGEKLHEKLILPYEPNYISDLKIECSENGDQLSKEEIINWLKDY
jgi:FlaA1/EpsC-like NDP-sugar epimerase